jgi:hypothetical protein
MMRGVLDRLVSPDRLCSLFVLTDSKPIGYRPSCEYLTGPEFMSVFNKQLWASNAKMISYYMVYGWVLHSGAILACMVLI